MPQAPNGNELWAIGVAWHRVCHKSGPLSRSIQNSTTILNGFALRVFLTALEHSRKLRSVSKCNTNEPETINKIAKTLKSQNQADRLLRYATRSQIAPRIQCHIPNQPKTHIRYKRVCQKRGRRQRRSLQINKETQRDRERECERKRYM